MTNQTSQFNPVKLIRQCILSLFLMVSTAHSVAQDLVNLTDAEANIKSEFCMGESVFMSPTYAFANFFYAGGTPIPYQLELLKVINGSEIQIAPIQNFQYFQSEINVTEIFCNALQNPLLFQLNVGYRLKLKINSFCGTNVLTKDFIYKCCGAPDASFSINNSGGSQITCSSSIFGQHFWTIYTATNVNTGPYTLVGSYVTPSFSYDGGNCYYIKHQISDDCGTSCAARTTCRASCEQEQCILSAPIVPPHNSGDRGYVPSWNPSSGATSYLLEVILSDPFCCGGNLQSVPIYIPVQGLSHLITDAELGVVPGSHPCYSWRVYSLCSDGSRSQPSAKQCSN